MATVGKPSKIGKYDVVKELGGGGMGTVYKAIDPGIGRTVAIKVIKGDFADNPELLSRFRSEARAVGRLTHPNIVVLHELDSDHGNPYLVMEYLDGTPLDKVISQRRDLTLIHKLEIIIEVLGALHFAHQSGIIHRDVKPANVMVLKDGHVKLLDFGIARQENLNLTKSGQLLGTMTYIAPEQLNEEVADARSDVYSTGIMLFELLTFSLPFEAKDSASLFNKRLRGDPPPPLSKYFDNYPLELDDIIARAMARYREERYDTAEDFAFDLGRVTERLKRSMVSHVVDQARASIANSDLAKAKELLSQALKIDTQNSTARQLFEEVRKSLEKIQRGERIQQIRTQAENSLAEKQLDDASDLIEQAISMDRTDPALLELRDQILEARSLSQQVKKKLNVANVARQSGELKMAQQAVADALAMDPDDTDAKVLQASIARLLAEHEHESRIQQFLQVARRDAGQRHFDAARDNVAKAKQIDPSHPEIQSLERLITASEEQEKKRAELQQTCSEIERHMKEQNPRVARDLAADALRKFPGEPKLVRLKTAADEAFEQLERRVYIEEHIESAKRFLASGQATDALKLLQDALRLFPNDPRVMEFLPVVREASAREATENEKRVILLKGRSALKRKSFAEAIEVLEGGKKQFPNEPEINELLDSARQEFERLSRQKQVEDVSRQVQDKLEAKSYTDAIKLLKRTSDQMPDPEFDRLLERAQREATTYRAGVRGVLVEATEMLNSGHAIEALHFLEQQESSYGRSRDFQGLLEQTRHQVDELQFARLEVLQKTQQARALIQRGDFAGAQALLQVCQSKAPTEPEVLALEILIKEEKRLLQQSQQSQAKHSANRLPLERQSASAETKFFDEELSSRKGATDIGGSGDVSGLRGLEASRQQSAATDWLGKAEPRPSEPQQVRNSSATLTPPPTDMGRKPSTGRESEFSAPRRGPAGDKEEPDAQRSVGPEPSPGGNKKLILIAVAALVLIAAGIATYKLMSPSTTTQFGYLKVNNAPSGATYSVNGSPVSPGADGTIKVTIGTYTVSVSAPGYISKSYSVTAEAGKIVSVDAVDLTREPTTPSGGEQAKETQPEKPLTLGKVLIAGNVDSVEVYDGDTYKGRTGKNGRLELSFTEGRHQFRFKKPGYKDSDKPFDVAANKPNRLTFELTKEVIETGVARTPQPPVDADVTIHTRPSASVRIGSISGQSQPDGSFTVKLPPGTYPILVSQSGYDDFNETITVKAGESVARNAPLNPKAKPAPVINFFETDQTTVEAGKDITLKWETQNATDIEIAGIGSGLSKNGQMTVTVKERKTFKLIARGEGGSPAERSVTISVTQPVAVTPPPVKPPTPEPTPNNAPTTGSATISADDEEAIQSVLRHFEQAINLGSIEELRKWWPNIPDATRKIFQENFNRARISVQERCDGKPTALSTDSAEWVCTEDRVVRGNDGKNVDSHDRWKFRFKKSKGWTIDNRTRA
jgi:serine/threonine-protein kinase